MLVSFLAASNVDVSALNARSLAPSARSLASNASIFNSDHNVTALNKLYCGSPHLPDELFIGNSGCGWGITGQVRDAIGAPVATFVDDCTAWNPSDLLFSNPITGQFLSTDQATFALFGNVFRFRDCQGKMVAWAQENIFTWQSGRGVSYNVYDIDDKLILRSNSGSFWDVHMIFEDKSGTPIGQAFMSWGKRMTQGWFCGGGEYDVSFPSYTPQQYREIVVALASIKAVRDQTRDSEGDVTGSWCHSFYKFLIIGLPSIAVFCCCACCTALLKRRGRGAGQVFRPNINPMFTEMGATPGSDMKRQATTNL